MFINEFLPIMIMQLCNLLFQCIYNKGGTKSKFGTRNLATLVVK